MKPWDCLSWDFIRRSSWSFSYKLRRGEKAEGRGQKGKTEGKRQRAGGRRERAAAMLQPIGSNLLGYGLLKVTIGNPTKKRREGMFYTLDPSL
jgi:hypothetical protein